MWKRFVCFVIGHKWKTEWMPNIRRVTVFRVIGRCPRCGKDGTGKFYKYP